MTNKSYQPFTDFLKTLVERKKISLEMLSEILGQKATNRMLDNADNEIGAPNLGAGNIAILQGQMNETLGAIPDAKGQLSVKEELLQKQNAEKYAETEQISLSNASKPPLPNI